MEVVIKLDDKDYEALNKVGHNGLEFNDTLEGRVYRAVANGTPLPEGHGDLVDRDKLSHIYRQMSHCSTAPNFIWVGELKTVQPVISASEILSNGCER